MARRRGTSCPRRRADEAAGGDDVGGVDSLPLGHGRVINDDLPAENGEVPLPDWSLFDEEDLVDLGDGLRAAFRERAIPTPAHVARDPQQLSTSAATACPSP